MHDTDFQFFTDLEKPCMIFQTFPRDLTEKNFQKLPCKENQTLGLKTLAFPIAPPPLRGGGASFF